MGAGMSFNPPLGGSATLAIPPAFNDDADVPCVFTARFEDARAAAQARRDGAHLELWSDLPVGGRAVGQWGALPFTWATRRRSDKPRLPAGTRALDLSPVPTAPEAGVGGAQPATESEDVLELRFSGHFPTPIWGGPIRFSYTYRFVYPDGGVRWLGEFGRDGQLFVERRDPRVVLGTPAGRGWARAPSGAYKWETGAQVNVELGKLNMALEWACWAVGHDGNATFYPTMKDIPSLVSPTLLALLPKTPANALTTHQPLLLTATGAATLTLKSDGTLTLSHGPGEPAAVSLRTFDGTRDLRSFAADLTADVNVRLVSAHPASGCIVLASPEATQPVTLSVVPLAFEAAAPAGAMLSVRQLAALAAGASGESVDAALFAPATGKALEVPADAKDEPVLLASGLCGAQAVLTLARTLPASDSDVVDGSVKLFLLTTHKAAAPREPTLEPVPEPTPAATSPTVEQEPSASPALEASGSELASTKEEVESSPKEEATDAPHTPKCVGEQLPSPPLTPTRLRSPELSESNDQTLADTSFASTLDTSFATTTDPDVSFVTAANTSMTTATSVDGIDVAQGVDEADADTPSMETEQSFATLTSLDSVSSYLRRRAVSMGESEATAVGESDEEDAEEPERRTRSLTAKDRSGGTTPRAHSQPPHGVASTALINSARTAKAIYQDRSWLRWYLNYLMRVSALVVGFMFARVFGARIAGRPSAAGVRVESGPASRTASPPRAVEQEVMYVDEDEEPAAEAKPEEASSTDDKAVVEAEAAATTLATEPALDDAAEPLAAEAETHEVPTPQAAEDTPDAEDDASTSSEVTDVPTPTHGVSPKIAEAALPASPPPTSDELAPIASDAAELTSIPEPAAPVLEPVAAPSKPALHFDVPAGAIEILVLPTTRGAQTAAADGLALELNGKAAVPLVSALEDALLLRLDGADAPTRLIVSLSA